MTDDQHHLDLLSIFHYIVGGLGLLFSLFPILHLFLGIAMITGRMQEEGGSENAPILFGWFFIVVALVVMATGIAYGICTILAGRYLQRRENYTFCLVMAAISCIFFPFGTVLGIFTILVLSRPGVKALFTPGTSNAGA